MAKSYNIPRRYNIREPQYIEQQNMEIHKIKLSEIQEELTKITIIVKILLKMWQLKYTKKVIMNLKGTQFEHNN